MEMHGSGLPISETWVWGSTLHQGACRARAGKASAMKENKNWWGKDTRAHTHTHTRTHAHTHARTHARTHDARTTHARTTHARTHAHTHARTHARTHTRFEFDEFPESDKEEWLEGIRSAEEEQEQEQQNSMDMQRSGSDRGFLRNTFRVAGS